MNLTHDYGLALDRAKALVAFATVVVVIGSGAGSWLADLFGAGYAAALTSVACAPALPRAHAATAALGILFWVTVAVGEVIERQALATVAQSVLLAFLVAGWHVVAGRRLGYFRALRRWLHA